MAKNDKHATKTDAPPTGAAVLTAGGSGARSVRRRRQQRVHRHRAPTWHGLKRDNGTPQAQGRRHQRAGGRHPAMPTRRDRREFRALQEDTAGGLVCTRRRRRTSGGDRGDLRRPQPVRVNDAPDDCDGSVGDSQHAERVTRRRRSARGRRSTTAPLCASYCSHTRRRRHRRLRPRSSFGVYWDRSAMSASLETCLDAEARAGPDRCRDRGRRAGIATISSGATFDWRGDPTRLHDLATWLLDRGFRPIIYVCTADGGTDVEIYDGTMQRVLRGAHRPRRSRVVSVSGGRSIAIAAAPSPPARRRDALLVCRRTLGDRAQLVWHGQPNRTTPASLLRQRLQQQAESRHAAALGRHAAARRRVGRRRRSVRTATNRARSTSSTLGFAEIDRDLLPNRSRPGRAELHRPAGRASTSSGNPAGGDARLECLDRFLPARHADARRDRATSAPTSSGRAARASWRRRRRRDSAGYRSAGLVRVTRGDADRPKWVFFETVPLRIHQRTAAATTPVQRCTREAVSFGCVHQGCAQ